MQRQQAEADVFEERLEAEIQEIIETRRREREARMRERRENSREAARLAIEDARANLRVLREIRETARETQRAASEEYPELEEYLEEQDEDEEERLEMLELSERIYRAATSDPHGARFMERDPREGLLEATDAYKNAENVVIVLEQLNEYFVMRRWTIEEDEDEDIETLRPLQMLITDEANLAQQRYDRAAIDKNDALLEYLIDPTEADRIERDIAENMIIARNPREADRIRAVINARRMQDPQFVRRQAEQEAIRQADPDIHVQADRMDDKLQDMMNKIIIILGGKRAYDKRTIVNYICEHLNNIVNTNAGYDQPEKENRLREITEVCNKLRGLGDSFSQEKINFMGYSIDYVMLQDELFQKLYADIFTNECRYAYPEYGVELNAMSCIAGMVERSYVFLPRVISLRLSMDNEETPLSSEKKQEYINLTGSPIHFNIDFLLEHAREWAKGDMPEGRNVKETIDARKESLGAYLINKMTSHAYELGIRIGNTERKMITDFLEDAFIEEDGSPQFGGKKRRIAKTQRKQRKTQRKARKTQRKVKKQRKTQRRVKKQRKARKTQRNAKKQGRS
jgi:hypothetical protein